MADVAFARGLALETAIRYKERRRHVFQHRQGCSPMPNLNDPATQAALHLSNQLGTLAAGAATPATTAPQPGMTAPTPLPQRLAAAIGHLHHRQRRRENTDKTL